MLLNSVILVLREVLEAAIFISVLLAMSLNLRCGIRWLWSAVPLGLVGTVLYASTLDVITDALDGAGQEVTNASLQALVYCFTVFIVGYGGMRTRSEHEVRILGVLMASAVALAMVREGSEIYLYITGFAAAQEHRTAVFAGSAIGAGIGLSLGVLLFSALRRLEGRWTMHCTLVLVCLIGAGMVMQTTMLLEQVDLLSAGRTLWDSSNLVSEQSITGELLYAVFGYESTPGVFQAALYTGSILLTGTVYVVARMREIS